METVATIMGPPMAKTARSTSRPKSRAAQARPARPGKPASARYWSQRVTRESNRVIAPGELFLIDSGAQYEDGTTDVTRTVVVGEPTAGWIIFTSGVQLIDGSNLRLPFDRITTNDGTLMEMQPRPVDIPVAKPIGESLRGHDSQLEAAVTELLKQIGSRSRGN